MRNIKRVKWAVLAVIWTAFAAGEAHAVSINRCAKLLRDPQVNRETVVNLCQQCIVAKVERRRPGSATDIPTMREFTLLPGAAQPLPFKGPGSSRITSELPCPSAR